MKPRLLVALVMLVGSGCSRRDSAPVDVQVVPSDPTPDPGGPKPEEPKSLLQLDMAALWDRTGPKRLTPEELEQEHHGRVVFADHPDECFATQLIGGGLAGPVTTIARLRVHSDVVKQVRTAAEQPPILKPKGGLLARLELVGAKRTTLIAVVEPATEANERFRRFIEEQVTPAVDAATGTATTAGPFPALPSGAVLSYRFPDRTGTITLALLPPSTDKKILDSVIAPGDTLGRSLITGRDDGESLLIAIVEERRQ